jgi:ribonuclease P/MRP protein subunit RPP40
LAIFCDLRKAFDTVNHGILLKKLSKVGVHGTELKWLENYLSERKQFVQVNGSPCNLLNILLGVPQGSILGPLLFLIYINDLPLCSKLCSYLFADDTTILASKLSTDALFTFINEEFRKIV